MLYITEMLLSHIANINVCARACLCESVCVRACVCAFMLFALNFDKYVFVENV